MPRATKIRRPSKAAATPSNDLGPWKPKDRLIFKYFNGERIVAADPLVLHEKLTAIEGLDLEQDVKTMALTYEMTRKEAKAAFHRVVDAVRIAFEVEPLHDGGGLTDAECVGLLDHFGRFILGVKKNMPDTPNYSPPTAPALSGDPEAIRRFAQLDGSLSESTTDEPRPSPSAATSPTGATSPATGSKS